MPLKCVTPDEFNKGIWYTVDPGIHTAIQEWNNGKLVRFTTATPAKKYDKSISYRVNSIVDQFDAFIDFDGSVLIEGVDLRTTNEASMASGARGNLFMLAYIIGGIMGAANGSGLKVYDPILYRDWAGQLSYEQLRTILKKKWNIDCTNDHIAAARGIGFAAKGLL